jgi:translation elongation factor aEF-1 beta
MGLAILKIRIMPESPATDLNKIESELKVVIAKEKGSNLRLEREPIAFGLIAINATFTREEILDSDSLVEKLKHIKNVNSAEITDFRRAIG